MARKIEVQVVGDADSLHRALGKAQGSTSKLGSVLGGALRVGALAAGGAILGLGYALKRGIDDFSESQKVAGQLQAVLKSTGGAANVTAKHVNNLAQSLSNMSGVDDEAIGAGENLLLTFRNIQNAAGKGNDIFDQATKATLDLSVAMGEDLHSAALQVGKALNDPVKGLTALKRVGVQFTDAQTNMIKKLVETGKTAEAQKIILGELRKEFGGSAKAAGETMAGQMNKLKNAFDNAASSIIQELLPYAVKLAQFAFPIVVGAIKKVADGIKGAIGWIADMASHFEVLGGKSTSAGDRIRHAWRQVVEFFRGNVMPIIRRLKDIFEESMKRIAKVVQDNGPAIRRIFERVGAALKAIAQVAMPILKTALVKVLPQIIGVAIKALDKLTFAIQQIVSGIKWIGRHSPGELQTASNAFKTFGDNVFKYLVPGLGQLLLMKDTVQWLADHIPSLPDMPGGSGLDIIRGIGHTSVLGAGAQAGAIFGVGGGRAGEINRKLNVNVFLDGKQILASVQQSDHRYRRQNGRSAFA